MQKHICAWSQKHKTSPQNTFQGQEIAAGLLFDLGAAVEKGVLNVAFNNALSKKLDIANYVLIHQSKLALL